MKIARIVKVPNCKAVINKLPNLTFTVNAAGNKLTFTPTQYLGVSELLLQNYYFFGLKIGPKN